MNALAKTDNWTNWLHLAREYAFLAAVIGITITWCEFLWFHDWPLLLAVPAACWSATCASHGQHHLTSSRTRRPTTCSSRIGCSTRSFPNGFACLVLGTTHSYRVQHLGHHQYPNDPERDPDWVQMTLSGHRFRFPMTQAGFVWECIVKQIVWFPKLIRYVLVRIFKPDEQREVLIA